MSMIDNFIGSFAPFGLTDAQTNDDTPKKRMIAVTNVVLLACIAISVVSVPTAYFHTNSLVFALVELLFLALYVFCLLLNTGHSHLQAKLLLVLVGCVNYVVLCLALGPLSGADIYALAMIAVPFLVFPHDEKRLMWTSYVLIGTSVIAVQIAFHHAAPFVEQGPEALRFSRIFCITATCLIVTGASLYHHLTVARAERRLEAAARRSDDLLHNILPVPITDRLKRRENPIADDCEDVTVLFADIVGFTSFAMRRSPDKVVSVLNEVFYKFDELADQLGLEKIKTIGDAYMVAGGLPRLQPDHAAACAEMALGMLAATDRLKHETGSNVTLRIGMHSGRVVAGVIGKNKFAYDLWGDTVNIASRIESTGSESHIHVSLATYELLNDRYTFSDPHIVELKGRGPMQAYFLTGRRINKPVSTIAG